MLWLHPRILISCYLILVVIFATPFIGQIGMVMVQLAESSMQDLNYFL
jgi:hypothetical protein